MTKKLLSALGLAAMGMLLTAQPAVATHPRPRGASPQRVPIVPDFEPCIAPNRTHGPPLAFSSCNPPVQDSTAVTIGTPDANGAAANSIGFVKFNVIVGAPGPPDDSDVAISSSISDVRCQGGTAACGNANTADGADYIGNLGESARIRIIDHFNAIGAGGGPDPATVMDSSCVGGGASCSSLLSVVEVCGNTASTAEGGLCTVNTSANAVLPGSVRDAKRAVVEVGQITVTDGGPDGAVATTPNTIFGVQGVFIP
jgi:hypothetical protein